MDSDTKNLSIILVAMVFIIAVWAVGLIQLGDMVKNKREEEPKASDMTIRRGDIETLPPVNGFMVFLNYSNPADENFTGHMEAVSCRIPVEKSVCTECIPSGLDVCSLNFTSSTYNSTVVAVFENIVDFETAPYRIEMKLIVDDYKMTFEEFYII